MCLLVRNNTEHFFQRLLQRLLHFGRMELKNCPAGRTQNEALSCQRILLRRKCLCPAIRPENQDKGLVMFGIMQSMTKRNCSVTFSVTKPFM